MKSIYAHSKILRKKGIRIEIVQNVTLNWIYISSFTLLKGFVR